METIEIMGLEGRDHSARCHAPNLGILAVRFEVDDAGEAQRLIEQRGGSISLPVRDFELAPYGTLRAFSIATPDGALIQFFERH